MAEHDKRCKCPDCVEPRHLRSKSTPHALDCDNCAHNRPCDYTAPRSPYLTVGRHLDIDPRPECRLCHEPYELGRGVNGVCPTCEHRKSLDRAQTLNELRGWMQ